MKKYKWVLGITIICMFSYFVVNYFPQNKSDNVTVKDTNKEEQGYTNLVAFAKLFGYVRYFHPSDEASEINWNLFAIYGVDKVKNAEKEKQLITALEDLFLPIAPTMTIYKDSEETKTLDHHAKEVIAWQHFGVGTSDASNKLYKSKRVTASIEGGSLSLEDNKLFEHYPEIDETRVKEISPGLFARIPLVLYKNEGKTAGSDEQSLEDFEKLKANLKKVDKLQDNENENVRFAGMIVAWNILQHFFPYFHVTDSKWESQLEVALKDTANNQNREEYISSLSKLLEKTKDGHAELTNYKYNLLDKRLPFVVDIIEGHVVVTVVEKESDLQLGDIIISMNERSAEDIIEHWKSEIVGSAQFKNRVATNYFSFGDKAKLEVLRGDEELALQIEGRPNFFLDEFARTETIKEMEKNIYLINLTRNDAMFAIENNAEQLANAKGIVFDLRGYPSSFDLMHHVIGHLIDEPVTGPIMRIPQTVYPDQEKVTYYEIIDPILPKLPKFKGETVFLTYSGAMSMPEFFLGYIRDNDLAEIVGQATAGSDGEILKYQIPGDITGIFTGMEVLNNDRSQTHIVGIEPTVPFERSMEKVKKGVDEYIEKAIELINN